MFNKGEFVLITQGRNRGKTARIIGGMTVDGSYTVEMLVKSGAYSHLMRRAMVHYSEMALLGRKVAA